MLHAIRNDLIDVLEQLDCTDCARKVVLAPINLRSLKSCFPARGCGQTGDLLVTEGQRNLVKKSAQYERPIALPIAYDLFKPLNSLVHKNRFSENE